MALLAVFTHLTFPLANSALLVIKSLLAASLHFRDAAAEGPASQAVMKTARCNKTACFNEGCTM